MHFPVQGREQLRIERHVLLSQIYGNNDMPWTQYKTQQNMKQVNEMHLKD